MRIDLERLIAELPAAGIARASRLGLALAPELKGDAWRGLVTHVARLAHSTAGARQTLTAWLGDVLAHRDASSRGLLTECAEAAGLDAGTLRNAKMVCARIPVSCRHDALSWTHHCEVGLAFNDAGEIERWLTLAEVERLSTAELRKRIRAHLAGRARGTPTATADTVAAFRLMRDLRAAGRMLGQQPGFGWHWTPATAQSSPWRNWNRWRISSTRCAFARSNWVRYKSKRSGQTNRLAINTGKKNQIPIRGSWCGRLGRGRSASGLASLVSRRMSMRRRRG